MADRKLVVYLVADDTELTAGYKRAAAATGAFGESAKTSSGHLDTLNKSSVVAMGGLASLARTALLAGGALVGVGSLYEGLKKSVEAAEGFNQAQRKLDAQLRANGESVRAVAPWVDKLAASQVQLGFTSTQTEKAFTQLDRASGSAATAYKYMAVTADLARARHIDLEKAAVLVGKVIDGNTSALNRYGIAIPKGTSAVDALRIAQQKLQGQAEASVTPFDKFHAVLNNIQVQIGNVLMPVIEKYMDKVTEWLSQTDNQKRITDILKAALHDVGEVIKTVSGIVQDMLPYIRQARDLFQEFADKVGGTKHAVELLGAAFATYKIASTIGGIGGAAEKATGQVNALQFGLKNLAKMSAIGLTISLILDHKALDDWLNAHHLHWATKGLAADLGLFGAGEGPVVPSSRDPYDTSPVGSGGPHTGVHYYPGPVIPGAPAAPSTTTPSAGASTSTSTGKARMLEFAKKAIGTPYLWGGAGPGGFDCSGLVQWAFANGLNISIPRTTYGQVTTGRLVGTNTLKGAQPGDVIFTQYGEGGKSGPGHEGIYIGGGQVLSAPHTGAKVGITSLAGFTSGGYYTVRDLTAGTAAATGPPGSTVLPGDAVKTATNAAKKAGGFTLPQKFANAIIAAQITGSINAQLAALKSALTYAEGQLAKTPTTSAKYAAAGQEVLDLRGQIDSLTKSATKEVASWTLPEKYTAAILKAQIDGNLQAQKQALTAALREAEHAYRSGQGGAAAGDEILSLRGQLSSINTAIQDAAKAQREAIAKHLKASSDKVITAWDKALAAVKVQTQTEQHLDAIARAPAAALTKLSEYWQKQWADAANKLAAPALGRFRNAQTQIDQLQQLAGVEVPGRVTDYTKQITNLVAEQVATLRAGIANLRGRPGAGGATTNLRTQLAQALNAQQGLMQGAVQAARTAYDAAINKFSQSFSKLSQDVTSQFEAQTQQHIGELGQQYFQGTQTPAEAQLAAMQVTDTLASLMDNINQAAASGDQKQIEQAQRALAEYNLQLRATQERAQADKDYADAVKQYTADRAQQEQDLTDALAKLGLGIQDGTQSISGLQPILDKFGVTMSGDVTNAAAGFAADLKAATTDQGGVISSLGALQQAFDALTSWINSHTGATIETPTDQGIGINDPNGPLAIAGVATGGKGGYYQIPGGRMVPLMASGGRILSSGLAYLHTGETVVPATGSKSNHYTFNFPNYVGDQRELTTSVVAALRRENRRGAIPDFNFS